MKKITKALVLALCVALAVCAFAVVSSAEEEEVEAEVPVFTVTSSGYSGAAGTFEGELISALNSGAPAIVKFESDGAFAGQWTIDNENADVIIDLNGHKLDMWASGSANKGLLVTAHGARITICDTSENGGGTINTNMPLFWIGTYIGRHTCGLTANPAVIGLDNVTVNYSGEGSGYGACPIEVEDLCVDLDINNCEFNSPNAGFIHIETNMSDYKHAFNFDVKNTEINAAAYVVRFDQGSWETMRAYYQVQNKVWNFENCTITTEGRDDVYPFVYPSWGDSIENYFNYITSHHYYLDDAGKTSGTGKGAVAPTVENLPLLNLNNCTVSTKADGLVYSAGLNFAVININGGDYKINTDGEVVNGENFINRNGQAQYFQAVNVAAYGDASDARNLRYPTFNFDPKAVESTAFIGISSPCYKNNRSYTYEKLGIYDTVAVTEGTWTLKDRACSLNVLYNLSLTDVLSINLAIPTKGDDKVDVKKVMNVNGSTIGSTGSMKFSTDGTNEYKVFQIKNINILSLTEVKSFIVVEKTYWQQTVVRVSVLDYIKAILTGDYNATEKELARSILAYALEAEKVAAEVDTEAVAELTEVLNNSGLTAPEAVTEFAGAKLDAELADTPLYGAAIDFSGNAPKLILALDEALAEDYVITVSYTGNRTAVNTKDYTFAAGTTQVTLSGISAFDFGNDLTITIDETDYVFNLAAILNRLMAADANYTGFANALYNYVNAAKAYQAVAPQY